MGLLDKADAVKNCKLLIKFAELFKSDKMLDITKTILCGNTILRCFPGYTNNVSTYAELNQNFEKLLTDHNYTDKDLINGLMKLESEELSLIAPDMWAEIYENEEFQKLSVPDSVKLQNKVNKFLHYRDVSGCNPEDVVLNADYLRRIITNSNLKADIQHDSLALVDEKVNEFIDSIGGTVAANWMFFKTGKEHGQETLIQGYSHKRLQELIFLTKNENWAKNATPMARLRLSDIKLYGEEKGNAIADAREDSINRAKNRQEKNALMAFHLNAHDKTRLAVLKAFGENTKAYLGADKTVANAQTISNSNVSSPDLKDEGQTLAGNSAPIDLENENNENIFLAQNVDGGNKENPHYISNVLATFGISTATSFGLGVAIPALANIPVIGNFIGPALAGTFAVGSIGVQVVKAFETAKAENRKLSRKEIAHIGINVGASVLPYAIMLAGGALTRGIGALVMGAKTFATDLINKRANLQVGQKLSGKEILKSLGGAAARGVAMFLGGTLGSHMANGVLNMGDFAPAALFQRGHNQITADEESLNALRAHKFELTDNARSTANPDNDRMYQLDETINRYTQQDWYDKAAYDRAISVLKEAGVQDADGALRNLAGANMFKGGEFKTELNNLLQGKLTTNTIAQILKADQILDKTGDYVGMLNQTTHTLPEATAHNPEAVKFSKLNFNDNNFKNGIRLPDNTEHIADNIENMAAEMANQGSSIPLPQTDFTVAQNITGEPLPQRNWVDLIGDKFSQQMEK